MTDIAIIGLACRVPGARNSEEFWRNLRDGVESISHFGPNELELRGGSAGSPASYVPARSILDDVDLFDASLFGIYPNEAKVIDPQHRVFLECCWTAIENAGYDPTTDPSTTGVFGGCSADTYFLHHLAQTRNFLLDFTETYQTDSLTTLWGMLGDMLATRVSYKLNLKGPSLTVQSACSTSLVAVCQAVKSLLLYECDMALAGGVSITFPQKRGYSYDAGGMVSPDGHCRAFDAAAQGTVFGHGAGVVVLKRLEDALEDGDHIHSVIKGTALNNDGGLKAGFGAPSVEGQARVIAMAQAAAGVEPSSIGYVEAHGTATPLGDPIEFAALVQAFRAGTDETGFCALGTAKTNVGHLDAAAGVTGLIKAVLSLQHRQIPPMLHFQQPNPQIDLENSPFYIATDLQPWTSPDGGPLRAGVSAFGVGGTNAHVVVEEAPPNSSPPSRRTAQLITLSGRSSSVVETARATLAEHLESRPDVSLADVAYTLNRGRHEFDHRWSAVCRSVPDAIASLRTPSRRPAPKLLREAAPVCFLFAGQGAQHVDMGRQLFETEPVFRREMERCAQILRPHLRLDLLAVLYPDASTADVAAAQLRDTALAQPAIFAVAYALTQLWSSWGIRPHSMVGHSVGEFVAACVAGVFSLEAALELIAARGEMMSSLPGGAMLSVRLSESEILPYLNDGLSLAAHNAPSLTVVSGSHESIEQLGSRLDTRGVPTRKLHTSHAFHSAMMEPIIDRFAERVATVSLHAPQIPFLSGVTGNWITDAQATDAMYWASHLRQTVRFSEAVQVVRKTPETVLLDIGPGTTMQTLARQHPTAGNADQLVVSSLPDASSGPENDAIYRALSQLWNAGVELDWNVFYEGEKRRRVPLPTYPFERKRYWIDAHESIERDQDAVSEQMTTPVQIAVDVPVQVEQSDKRAASIKEANLEEVQMTFDRTAAPDRTNRIAGQLKALLQDLSGLEPEEIDPSTSFLEMGFDSLFLTQVTQGLQSVFGVKITFGQLMDGLPSLDALAQYLDAQLPPDAIAEVAPLEVKVEQPPLPAPTTARLTSAETAPVAPLAVYSPSLSGSDTSLERLIQEQLRTISQVMEQQLNALRGVSLSSVETAIPAQTVASSTQEAPAMQPEDVRGDRSAATNSPVADEQAAAKDREFKPFGPYKPIQKGPTGGLTPRQEAFLQTLIGRYTAKTAQSKRLTQEARPYLADPRAAAGFRLQWKEMVYPIVTNRSSGSRLWDVDGNEYIDILNGFGPIAFGHRPDFLTEAVRKQLDEGFEIGPQTPLAGEVAQLICKLTGVERVTFCNTGSEAVMAAIRIARTVTGRQKIVLFAGSYHGTFDEVLVKHVGKVDSGRTNPIAPGIPRENVQNVVVLDYGTPESLNWIREHAGDLAAVLVEPVQSRHPALQPRAFLQELRAITEASDCAMIIDEVVTGFRAHPGGIQALFDIRADLVTYGKMVGGGLPIGVLAGKAAFMDALDGGMWQYGDDSFPEIGVTFFAGTFVRHPLALAAAKAVLEHLDQQGPALQEGLAKKAVGLVARVNNLFEVAGVPARIETFGSVFYFSFPSDFQFGSLLYYLLRDKGIHIQEGFPCFLSTAHSDDDIESIYQAFAASIADLQDGGFLTQQDESTGEGGGPVSVYPVPVYKAHSNALEATPNASGVSSEVWTVSKTAPQPLENIAQHSVLEPIIPGAGPEEAPLTESQLEIWLATQHGDDASCAYNEAFTLSLRGELDVAAFTDSIHQVIARHDALRATFDLDGQSMRFKRRLEIEVPLLDFSAFESSDERLQTLIEEDAKSPFDLVQGPLVRVCLMRLAPQHHVLLFTSHHIICDGWSANVILEELGILYSAYRDQRLADLPPAPSFGTHAAKENQEAESTAQATLSKYWLAQFAEIPPALELPTDRPRPAVKSFHGATVRHFVDKDVRETVKKVGARHGCTLFSTLLAGFEALLCRLSNQRDVVVGVPAAAQSTLDGQTLVGHCVNLLPLRARIPEVITVADFLKQSKRALLGAYEHQNYTYGTLVRQLSLQRDPSRLPLVEVQFNLERLGTTAQFSELEVAVDSCPKAFVNCDLFMNIVDTAEGLVIDCDYNTDLFDAKTVKRWLHHYQTLLTGIADNPDQQLHALPLLTATESDELLIAWNATPDRIIDESTIHEFFEAQVVRTPKAVAVRDGSKRLSYDELNSRANRLAHCLRECGVGPDVVVGLCMERSLDMVVGLLGILKAGGAYLPLDPNYPAERLTFMVGDSQTSTVVTQQRLAMRFSSTEHVICLDSDISLAKQSAVNPVGTSTDRNLAYVIYTSGSTGQPKGVAIEHHSTVALINWAREAFSAEELAGVLASTSICFDLSVFELFVPLSLGGTVILAQDLLRLPSLPAAAEVTLVNTVPSVLAEMLQNYPLPASVRTVNLAGEALHRGLVSDLYAQPTVQKIYNLYGPSEDTTYSTWALMDRNDDGPPSIGRPITGTQVYLLDQYLNPVPVGVPGELFLGGGGLARAYLNRAQLTAEKFVCLPFNGDRVYRTGDLARYRSDGDLEYLGRIDHQVKLRGFRIELGEIEAVLKRHPDVQEAAAEVREDPPGDKRLVAYIAMRKSTGETDASDDLHGYVKQFLPGYMVPSSFVLLETLPHTASGKVDRNALATAVAQVPQSSHAFVAPTTLLHHQLILIWEDLLGVHPIGIRDNFFDLGGHSLLAVRLMRQIEELCGKKIPLSTLFTNGTVENLARTLVQQERRPSDRMLIEIQSGGSQRPFFYLHGDFEGGGLYCSRLAKGMGPDRPFFALQPHTLCGRSVPHSIEEMAGDYVALLRSVQATGPYSLGGFCEGGLVAFEIAQQLRAQGEDVEDVILIDVGSGSARRQKARALLNRVCNALGMPLDLQREFYTYLRVMRNHFLLGFTSQTHRHTGRLARACKSLVGLRSSADSFLTPGATDENSDLMLSNNWWANAGYTPKPYPGKVIMLWADEEPSEESEDSAWHWADVAAKFEMRSVPGSHYTCITTHAEALAEQIQSCLGESFRPPSASIDESQTLQNRLPG